MSRPMLLVCLLLILIITSQFEWRQQLVSDMDTNPAESQKQHQISKREEGVKEKIILSQEKSIQKLNEVVKSLREQLQQCRSSNETTLTHWVRNLSSKASHLCDESNYTTEWDLNHLPSSQSHAPRAKASWVA
ncbi:uncharacterized protein LOC125209267 [Salvia hispanica]|uniref:uncharacterized protein LOC125209267 n=1 Tax=Salvia hispanica TaxID=49212 RepID=UPI0020093057|nr:uncharacterized protein LOC125209267 [Salvia hispanica]